MPIILKVLDHDELYKNLKYKPIIINDLANTTEADKEHIRALTLTQLNSDTVSTVPSCSPSCGVTKGRYALGKTCPVCKEVVQSNIDQSVESLLWFRAPQYVDKLLNPVIWAMLSKYFTKNSYDAIQYLTDNLYSPNTRVPAVIDKLNRRGYERDYNYFCRNFDEIVETLMEIYPATRSRPYALLRKFLADNRHKIFSNQIPLLNKTMFVTDKTNVGVFMEDSIRDALDAIYHVVSIDKDFYDRNPKVIVNRTARMLARSSAFYTNYIKTNFQPKPGHYRRHIMGTRNIFSGRAVISSLTGNHSFDEIGIPWKLGVTIFQHHLTGKLMRHGFSNNGALGYVIRHVNVYNELIHRLLDETFSEFKGGRGPVFCLHRNPTLLQGSFARVYGFLKTDPRDTTISTSILTVSSMNADFDGDALNLMFSVDSKMADAWEPLAHEFNTFVLDNPMEVSGNIALTKPIVMSGGAWLDDD